MSDQILKQLLKEYDKKRFIEEELADYKKKAFFTTHPELEKINTDLNTLAISISKSVLSNNLEKKNELQMQFNNLQSKKKLLYKQLNITDNFFLPQYECPLCNDTGYILDSNNKSILCNCIKQKLFNIKYNSSNIGDLDKENFSSFNLSLYSDEINKDKYKANISPQKNMENVLNIAKRFINNFDNPNEKNLLFTGNTGCGKTFLTNCIANELLKQGKNVLYQTAPVMLDNVIDTKFGKENAKFDLIVSNPPYIKENVISTLSKDVQNEPHIALSGGIDGLDFYRIIANNAYKYLKYQGKVLVEIGYDQEESVENLFEQTNQYDKIRCIKDLSGNDRVIEISI